MIVEDPIVSRFWPNMMFKNIIFSDILVKTLFLLLLKDKSIVEIAREVNWEIVLRCLSQ